MTIVFTVCMQPLSQSITWKTFVKEAETKPEENQQICFNVLSNKKGFEKVFEDTQGAVMSIQWIVVNFC